MHRKLAFVVSCVLVLMFVSCVTNRAFAQECPRSNPSGPTVPSQASTLEGRLIFHDSVRKWFELKLDRPRCGQSSVQLIQSDEKSKPIEVFRGCRVKSSGTIDFSSTGYFSLDVFQDVEKVEPVGTCLLRPLLPDYSSAKPDALIRSYTVEMHVIYQPGDHPIIFHVRSARRELRPWQAYASYSLTGSYALYGHCGDGFVVDKVFGTRQARPGHFDEPRTSDDMATFDPESAAEAGKRDLRLGYTCIRKP